METTIDKNQRIAEISRAIKKYGKLRKIEEFSAQLRAFRKEFPGIAEEMDGLLAVKGPRARSGVPFNPRRPSKGEAEFAKLWGELEIYAAERGLRIHEALTEWRLREPAKHKRLAELRDCRARAGADERGLETLLFEQVPVALARPYVRALLEDDKARSKYSSRVEFLEALKGERPDLFASDGRATMAVDALLKELERRGKLEEFEKRVAEGAVAVSATGQLDEKARKLIDEGEADNYLEALKAVRKANPALAKKADAEGPMTGTLGALGFKSGPAPSGKGSSSPTVLIHERAWQLVLDEKEENYIEAVKRVRREDPALAKAADDEWRAKLR